MPRFGVELSETTMRLLKEYKDVAFRRTRWDNYCPDGIPMIWVMN
jgi:hypothetical protein